MAAIEVRNLQRSFEGGVTAVAGVDLEVAEGEIFSFLGPNGAGKTTTVRMLTTLLRPTGGSARVAGYDVVDDAAGRAPRDRGRPPGGGARPADDRPRAAPAPGDPARPAAKQVAPRSEALLDRVGLTDAADRRVGTYSGGMQRRLDLASALVHEPRVLFLDEPTTGLDPVSRKTIWEEVRKLNDEGTTVFLTTQYLEEADQLAERVAIIAKGVIVAEGTPTSLKAEVGNPRLEVTLAEGSPTGLRARARGVRQAAAGEGRHADRRARARRRADRARRPGSGRGRDPGRVAGAGRADARRRLRREDRRAPRRRRGQGRRRTRTRSRRRCRDQPSRMAGRDRARSALGQADLQAPAADGAAADLPDAAAGDPDRRRRPRRRPARLPAGAELPRLHARRGDGAVDAARRQHGRDRARGRHRDGLHRPPADRADPTLRDRARPARRHRGARALHRRSGSWCSASSSASGSRRACRGRS